MLAIVSAEALYHKAYNDDDPAHHPPSATVFLAESPGPYAGTFPSARPFGRLAPHAGKGNILFLDGHVADFDADYLGVGRGDPGREDIRWLTGTPSDAQAGNYQ
jgi:prepilin-type processing-associated H-X9-DG protein